MGPIIFRSSLSVFMLTSYVNYHCAQLSLEITFTETPVNFLRAFATFECKLLVVNNMHEPKAILEITFSLAVGSECQFTTFLRVCLTQV